MDLRDGKITIGEILDHPAAHALLLQEFPALLNHPMLHRAGKITLNMAIALAGDALSPERRRRVLEKLRQL